MVDCFFCLHLGMLNNSKNKEMNTDISYEMFSKQGNKACSSLVKKAIRKIKGKNKVEPLQILDLLKTGMRKIEKKHEEIFDSEPPYHITRLVNKAISENGYSWEIDDYDLY